MYMPVHTHHSHPYFECIDAHGAPPAGATKDKVMTPVDTTTPTAEKLALEIKDLNFFYGSFQGSERHQLGYS